MPLLPPIPGYAEAVQKEREIRERAFLDVSEQIAGIDASPLSMDHLIRLNAVKSPFVTGAPLRIEELPVAVSIFLWMVSPQFRPFSDDPQERKLDMEVHGKFMRSLRKLNFLEAVEEIDAYIEDAFFDAPGGKVSKISYYSWHAAVISVIAKEFGWSEEAILSIPLKRVWQYVRALSTKCLTNPLSDRVRGDWLAKLNRGEINLDGTPGPNSKLAGGAHV